MPKKESFDYLFKIVMIGDSGVGKTNLLSRFVDGSFTFDSKPTIGVEFATRTIKNDDKIIKNQIWDTAGQQRFRAISNAYYRGAVGAIVVFDLSKSRTFQNVQKWLSELREHVDQDISIMILGNKSDLEREVSKQTVEDYINANRLLYMQSSASTGSNVQEAFTHLIQTIYQKSKNLPINTPKQPINGQNEIIKKDEMNKTKETKGQQLNENKNETIKIAATKNEKQKKKGCC